jgi:hypothetical protein
VGQARLGRGLAAKELVDQRAATLGVVEEGGVAPWDDLEPRVGYEGVGALADLWAAVWVLLAPDHEHWHHELPQLGLREKFGERIRAASWRRPGVESAVKNGSPRMPGSATARLQDAHGKRRISETHAPARDLDSTRGKQPGARPARTTWSRDRLHAEAERGSLGRRSRC